jgi:O-antigen ligase
VRAAGSFAPAALGAWTAAVATVRGPEAAVLAGAPAAAVVAWWSLAGANRWLALFFACALLLPPVPIAGSGSLHPAPLVAALGVLAGILRAHEWRPAGGALPFALAAFLAVLGESIAFAAWYSGPQVAAGTLARVLLFAIGIYIFLYAYTGPGACEDPFPMVRLLFWAGMASAAFACLDFRYQFPAPAGYGAQFVWLSEGVLRRAQGVFYEASTLGNLCVFFLVMIAVALSEPDGRRVSPRPALAAGAALFAAALVFSYSRGSVVALAVALAALGRVRGARIWKSAAVLLGCAAIGALALNSAFPAISNHYWLRLVSSVEYIGSSPNGVLSGRLTAWTTLLDFLVREPWNGVFGVGYKTLPYSDIAGGHVIADNTYLSLLVETGVTGLIVFLLMNAAILRTAWRAATSARPRAAFFGKWIFCFWCGQMVQMLSGDLITYWRVLPVYLWVLATAAREAREVG